MSVMPYQPGQSMSPRDFGLQLLATQMSRAPEDTSIGVNVAAALGAHTVATISESSVNMQTRLTACLKDLNDPQAATEVGKTLVSTHERLSKSLTDIADAIARTINRP